MGSSCNKHTARRNRNGMWAANRDVLYIRVLVRAAHVTHSFSRVNALQLLRAAEGLLPLLAWLLGFAFELQKHT